MMHQGMTDHLSNRNQVVLHPLPYGPGGTGRAIACRQCIILGIDSEGHRVRGQQCRN